MWLREELWKETSRIEEHYENLVQWKQKIKSILIKSPSNEGDGPSTGLILLPNESSSTGLHSIYVGQRHPMESTKQP